MEHEKLCLRIGGCELELSVVAQGATVGNAVIPPIPAHFAIDKVLLVTTPFVGHDSVRADITQLISVLHGWPDLEDAAVMAWLQDQK